MFFALIPMAVNLLKGINKDNKQVIIPPEKDNTRLYAFIALGVVAIILIAVIVIKNNK